MTTSPRPGYGSRSWTRVPPRTSRRGELWIPGTRVEKEGGTYQRGAMFVAWEAPVSLVHPDPVVLVHGGATQGTEWLDTPDGRPGWAQRLVEAGYAVFVVDRPTQGRSRYQVEAVGEPGPGFTYEEGRMAFFPGSMAASHTEWPFDPGDGPATDAFIAQFGPLPADLVLSQQMDADAIAALLDRIGPAVVVTHSASGPVGWLVADRRPALVRAIVAVEPMGPPFATIPNIGTLTWGLTAAPLRYDPARDGPDELRAADPAERRVPALDGIPIAVVNGGASPFADAGRATVDHLVAAGADVEHLRLADHGVDGNGHGLIYELNSDDALQPVLRWLSARLPAHTATANQPRS